MKEYKVCSFEYNGFCGHVKQNKLVNYTASFKEWTSDPGVALFSCSDYKDRLIPVFALKNFKISDLPKQEYGINCGKKVMFGLSCNS